MKKIASLILILISFFHSSDSNAQDAREFVERIAKKFRLVHDYQADATIRIDIPFIKMMPVHATVYFQQPDLLKVKSKGIAILPKQGFDQMLHLLADTLNYSAMLQSTQKENGKLQTIVNLIPISDSSDLILAKLWIDQDAQLLTKAQLTTKTNGTIVSEYRYGAQSKYALPDSIIFTIDTRKFKIPKAVSADINTNSDRTPEGDKEKKKGKITVRIEHYVLNKGIPAEIFKGKNKENEE